MEQAKYQTQQTMNSQIFMIKPLNLKKITQLIFSAYVLSFLFSWLSFHFLWTFPIRLFSHAIDKRCMFLIFNGILVLIASNSGLIGSGSPESDNYELTLSVDSLELEAQVPLTVDSLVSEAQAPLLDDEVVVEEKREGEELLVTKYDQEEEEKTEVFLSKDEEEKESEVNNFVEEGGGEEEELLVTKYDQEEEEKTEVFLSKDEEEKESEANNFVEEGGGEEEMMSTEELNKKFDDFIRKMKQEIKIEAQQQLVVSG